jgi:hypothetical protein
LLRQDLNVGPRPDHKVKAQEVELDS